MKSLYESIMNSNPEQTNKIIGENYEIYEKIEKMFAKLLKGNTHTDAYREIDGIHIYKFQFDMDRKLIEKRVERFYNDFLSIAKRFWKIYNNENLELSFGTRDPKEKGSPFNFYHNTMVYFDTQYHWDNYTRFNPAFPGCIRIYLNEDAKKVVDITISSEFKYMIDNAI